jgi:hypothetical protein
VDPFLSWIEQMPVSIWIRETDSLFAFPFVITVHAIGFAMVVGTCFAIDFRLVGFLPKVPVPAMDRFVPVIWIGLALNAVSGVFLVMAYPAKALTNPVFYLKLVLITLGLASLVAIRRVVFHGTSDIPTRIERGKALAVTSLVLWTGAMTAGRLLAYTCTRLMVDFGSCP